MGIISISLRTVYRISVSDIVWSISCFLKVFQYVNTKLCLNIVLVDTWEGHLGIARNRSYYSVQSYSTWKGLEECVVCGIEGMHPSFICFACSLLKLVCRLCCLLRFCDDHDSREQVREGKACMWVFCVIVCNLAFKYFLFVI